MQWEEISQHSVKVLGSSSFLREEDGASLMAKASLLGREFLGISSVSTVCVGLFLHSSESCPK